MCAYKLMFEGVYVCMCTRFSHMNVCLSVYVLMYIHMCMFVCEPSGCSSCMGGYVQVERERERKRDRKSQRTGYGNM